jgi:hypothetical protein
MKIHNVLIFPAGTEVGLEIYQALKNCKEVKLFGAGANISNHAQFIFKPYYQISSIYSNEWLNQLINLCNELKIDYIFPGYDDVIVALRKNENFIPAKIIAPSNEACEITRSKSHTYALLKNIVRTPKIYLNQNEINELWYNHFPEDSPKVRKHRVTKTK